MADTNDDQNTMDAGGYPSVEAFHANLEQIFVNAKTYNVRGSQVYADALALQVSNLTEMQPRQTNHFVEIGQCTGGRLSGGQCHRRGASTHVGC